MNEIVNEHSANEQEINQSQPSTDVTSLRNNIASIAEQEWRRWNQSGRRTETDPRMSATLADYWWTGARVRVTPSQMRSTYFQKDHSWSAAFISWVVRQARAGTSFQYSAAHANYIVTAKRNRLANNANPFRAYRLTEATIQPGDIICTSRDRSVADYDSIRSGMKAHCDIVVAVHPNQIIAIGGNVANSVSQKVLPLSPSGHLIAPGYFAVIKVGGFPRAVLPQPVSAPPPTKDLVPIPAPGPSTSGRTIYAPIDLGIRQGRGRVQPQSGIYCPPGFRPGRSVDMVIYLHGIRNPTTTVDSYWNASRNSHFAIREDFSRSRKNAILVVPLLGANSQSQIGILAARGGLDQYVNQVLKALMSHGAVPQNAAIGNLILACHSGGGHAMRLIVSAQNATTAALRGCWGFDCMYGVKTRPDDATFWSAWALQNPLRRLFIYYQSSTANQSQKLKSLNLSNATVERSNARNHYWVPRTHFLHRLTNAKDLAPVGGT